MILNLSKETKRDLITLARRKKMSLHDFIVEKLKDVAFERGVERIDFRALEALRKSIPMHDAFANTSNPLK